MLGFQSHHTQSPHREFSEKQIQSSHVITSTVNSGKIVSNILLEVGKGKRDLEFTLPMVWLRSGKTSRSCWNKNLPHEPNVSPAKFTGAFIFFGGRVCCCPGFAGQAGPVGPSPSILVKGIRSSIGGSCASCIDCAAARTPSGSRRCCKESPVLSGERAAVTTPPS